VGVGEPLTPNNRSSAEFHDQRRSPPRSTPVHFTCNRRWFCVRHSSSKRQIHSDACQKSRALIPAPPIPPKLPISPPHKRGCKRAIGAARLGGERVDALQAKPGRFDGHRSAVALICCRWRGCVSDRQQGPDWGSAKSVAWSEQRSAAVGHSANAPDNPGERPKPQSRRRSRAPAGSAYQLPVSNQRWALLRRCSL
jgi:hypothetical protein